MKKLFGWLIDKWLAGFLTASFFFLLKLYIDLPQEEKSNFFNFKWLKSILTTDIKLWQAIIAIAFILTMVVVRNWWKKKKDNSHSKFLSRPNEPAFNYRIDTFGVDNAKWTWDYDWDPYKKTIMVKDVLPLCPVCNSKMELDNYSTSSATCVKCRLEGKNSYFPLKQFDSDVSKEIVRRLNSGEWKDRKK